MGYGTGLYPRSEYVAVKMPVFSFEKLRDVDISLGPEMKSTGEVLGVSRDFREALVKALLGAGIRPGINKTIMATVCDKDKEELSEILKQFADLGYTIYATEGTQKHLKEKGIDAIRVNKVSEPSPNIIDYISGGGMDLVINTPHGTHRTESDGFKIRRTTVERNIPCFTSLDTAKAVLSSISGGEIQYLSCVDITELSKKR